MYLMATKGKTVGCWLKGSIVEALNEALRANPHATESEYGGIAIEDRLRREGFLKDTKTGQIAARAAELAVEVGEELVTSALDEVEEEHMRRVGGVGILKGGGR